LLLFAASWVVPVAGPPIRDGCVAVEAGRIVWVGPRSGAGAPGGPLRDLGDGVLMPGLVNAHCHLELTALRREPAAAPDRSVFVDWVSALVAARGSLAPARMREGAETGIAELLESGTVAVGDVSNDLAHVDLMRRAGLDGVAFFELLGWDPAGAEAILERTEERLARLEPGPPEVRLAAHAPYSVSSRLFGMLVKRGGLAAVHLAESPEETAFLQDGTGALAAFLLERVGPVPFEPPGSSPVQYLDSLGVLRPGLLAAHCVQVGARDQALLAERGVHVAVCPRSNRNLGVGIPPVPDMLRAGVAVCLGTDSAASAGALDLMQDVAALQREFPDLDPAVIVGMATAAGAKALGLVDLGALAPGRRARLAFAAGASNRPLDFLTSGEARLRPVEC
jgi:cytosine/adenosine deaminase-related metal-dependent hydrolase